VKKSKQESRRTPKRYGNESDVEQLTGIPRRTLQKHRLLGKGFPFYRVGGRIIYDLNEVEEIIRAGRVNGGGRAA
jgi:hypothetical protein